MDVKLFHHDLYVQQYNCSFYSVDMIPLEKRQHIIIGVVFICLFFTFEILYIPSLIIMRQKQFYQQSCYKLMFFMGLTDIVCMFINGFFTGLFAIKGYVFCSSPDLIYYLGIGGVSLWAVQSDCGMFLGLNRCFEMYDPKLNALLFKGKKTYLWIMIATIHALVFAIFTKPVAYSAIYVSWFFNPHVGYFDDYGATYYNILHTIHNITVLVVLTSCYIVFIFLLFKKSHLFSGATRQSSSQKESYAQVFIICFVNATAAGIYVYMQFFPVPEMIILAGQYAWLLAHGAPSVIYLSINKSIQRRIKRKIGHHQTVATVSTKIAPTSTINASTSHDTPSVT